MQAFLGNPNWCVSITSSLVNVSGLIPINNCLGMDFIWYQTQVVLKKTLISLYV